MKICLRLFLMLLSQGLMCEDKQFVFVVTSYNNEKWCMQNLDSLFSQNYPYLRVIYVNDASTDSTGTLVKNYIKQHQLEGVCTYIENSERHNKLYNLYHAIHSCDDRDIIVEVDGDDWLAHNNVLTLLNTIYQNENIWLTYGQFQSTLGKIGFCVPYEPEIIKYNRFRDVCWKSSQLRTFYAKLFKLVKRKDLVLNDNFFKTTSDLAMFYPMLEMAQERHLCVSEILYLYNEHNPLNDVKVNLQEQLRIDYIVKKKKKYSRLKALWD
jgi:glycosyltransferase involved in cell wall biosynthesis